MIEKQPNLPIDRQIKEVSVHINRTRALLAALERQREMLVGMKQGLIPKPGEARIS